MRKTKTGRRCGKDERARARELVELYRAAQAAPGGRLCLNPDDEPEIQTWIDGSDPELLLRYLADFAEHGTFAWVDTIGVYELLTRSDARRRLAEVRQERAQNPKVRNGEKGLPDPMETVAKELNLSKRTLERILSPSAK